MRPRPGGGGKSACAGGVADYVEAVGTVRPSGEVWTGSNPSARKGPAWGVNQLPCVLKPACFSTRNCPSTSLRLTPLKPIKFIPALLLAVSLAALLGGCATAGHQRAGSAAASLRQGAEQLSRSATHLDNALVSLAALLDAPAGDLKPQFNTYQTSANRLESAAREFHSRWLAIQRQANAYLQQWDSDLALIQNADIRQRSAARKGEVQEQFNRTQTAAGKLRADWEPVVSDLKDLRTALGADLTPAGVDNLRAEGRRVSARGVRLREGITSLAVEYQQLASGLSPAPPTSK